MRNNRIFRNVKLFFIQTCPEPIYKLRQRMILSNVYITIDFAVIFNKGKMMLETVYGIGICAIVFIINYKYDINLLIQLSILAVINSLLFIFYIFVGKSIQDIDMAIGTIVGGLIVSVMTTPLLTFVAFKGRELR